MANISVTRRCRRGCSYCFARPELARSAVMDMPPDVFERALMFLRRSGIPEARLLGGEPTEHPHFCDFVDRARQLDLTVLVFTGGFVPDEVVEYLRALPAEGVHLLLNAADPAVDDPALLRSQERLCRALGSKVMLGVNIRSWGQDPRHVLDWVGRFDLDTMIRVGLAHPTWGGTNVWFPYRRPRPLPIIEHLVIAAANAGFQVSFDCGFTPCMFSEAFLNRCPNIFPPAEDQPCAERVPGAGAVIPSHAQILDPGGSRCGPAIDILPDGECVACYAMSSVARLPLPDEDTREDLVTAFNSMLTSKSPLGIFPECSGCRHRENRACEGGCRARRSLRYRPLSPLLSDEQGTRISR